MPEDRIYLDEIKRYKAEPGDVLVLRVKRRMKHAEYERIRDTVRKAFPGQNALLLEEDATLEVVQHACQDENQMSLPCCGEC